MEACAWATDGSECAISIVAMSFLSRGAAAVVFLRVIMDDQFGFDPKVPRFLGTSVREFKDY